MPATPAHLVTALPLRRFATRPGELEALFWGTMVPDIGHIIPHLSDERNFAHSPLGLFAFCLPVGLLVLLLWRTLWARPCVDLIPGWWREDALRHIQQPIVLRQSWRLGLFLLLGSLSHILLDIPSHLAEDPRRAVALQIILTVLGLGLVATWLWRHRRPSPNDDAVRQWRLWSWLGLGFATLVITLWNTPHIALWPFDFWVLHDVLWNAGKIILPAFHGCLIIYAALWWRLEAKRLRQLTDVH